MRKVILSLSFMLIACVGIAHAQAVFKKYGFNKAPLTLSNGKYNEFFTNEEIVQIGTVKLNTRTNQIVEFLEEDTTKVKYKSEFSSRWLSVDPLAEKYPNYSPYVYCANSPVRYIDPDGRLLVDTQGNLVFIPIGKDVAKHAGDKEGAKVEYGFVFANDGTGILSFRNLSNKKGWDTDCHGQTFTNGKYWISNEEVESIITGDGYARVKSKKELKVGDIVVYRNSKTGEVEDSRTVSKINKKTGEILVYGQGGLDPENYNKDIDEAWGGTQTYYRKTQQNKKVDDQTIKKIKQEVQQSVKKKK